MGKQRTFAGLAWQTKGKVTRRERFLAEMNAVIEVSATDMVGMALLMAGIVCMSW